MDPTGPDGPGAVRVRRATAADEGVLLHALFYAAQVDEDEEADLGSIRDDPYLIRYVAGWGRDGDLGVVAEIDGVPVGAAWLRLLGDSERDRPTYVDASTPELAVAVLPSYVNRGIGTRMLTTLFAAVPRPGAVTLSVRESNPAKRLYERLGFTVVGEMTNRVGGRSYLMLLELR